jgi:hypothetical protein
LWQRKNREMGRETGIGRGLCEEED